MAVERPPPFLAYLAANRLDLIYLRPSRYAMLMLLTECHLEKYSTLWRTCVLKAFVLQQTQNALVMHENQDSN